MISKDLILNQLYKKEQFVFSQGPYYLPTRLMSRRTGRGYSIRKSIQDHIENEDKTGAVKTFLELFDPWAKSQEGRKFDYIRECVFLIRQKDYQTWVSLYSGSRDERLSRNLFITDLFFPYLHLIVELDGMSYHDYLDEDKHNYDVARDQFLFSVYGIKTIRLTEDTVEKRFSTIKRVLRKQDEYEIPANLDYSDEIVDMYLNHTYFPECFELIEKYILPIPDFYNIKNINVGFPKDLMKPSEIKFIQDNEIYLKEILNDLYEKNLII